MSYTSRLDVKRLDCHVEEVVTSLTKCDEGGGSSARQPLLCEESRPSGRKQMTTQQLDAIITLHGPSQRSPVEPTAKLPD